MTLIIGTEGEVLASFQLLSQDEAPKYPITNITPTYKVWFFPPNFVALLIVRKGL